MPKLTQYQTALIAFLLGGVIVIIVFLVTSGGGDSDDDDNDTATAGTATASVSVTPRSTATEDPDGTSTIEATATEDAAPSATVPPPTATATSPPPAATATQIPPSATSPPTATFTPTPTPTATNTPTPTATATEVVGIWHGMWQTNCPSSNCGNMELTQLGNIVVGTYANGAGTIDGTVIGNRLSGTWTRNGISGSIDFWVDASGDNWLGNYNGRLAWCGRRAGEAYPTPCGVASWYGTWTTNCGSGNCGSMTLQQNGTSVNGTYAGGSGVISGTASGTSLDGTWLRGGFLGSISFNMLTSGDQFNGNFGPGNMWCGWRNGEVQPVPCLN